MKVRILASERVHYECIVEMDPAIFAVYERRLDDRATVDAAAQEIIELYMASRNPVGTDDAEVDHFEEEKGAR